MKTFIGLQRGTTRTFVKQVHPRAPKLASALLVLPDNGMV